MNANQPSPGVVVHKGHEKMQIGVEWSDKIDRGVQQYKTDLFLAVLYAGKSEYDEVPDIQVWRWKKTIWVRAFSLSLTLREGVLFSFLFGLF